MPLHITVGPPGVGKTTWAAKKKLELGPDCLHLSRDRLRDAVFGSKEEFFSEHNPIGSIGGSKMIRQMMLGALAHWPNTLVLNSDTNVYERSAMFLVDRWNKSSVHVYYFKIEEELYLEKNRTRDLADKVPEATLRTMWLAYTQKNPWWSRYNVTEIDCGEQICS